MPIKRNLIGEKDRNNHNKNSSVSFVMPRFMVIYEIAALNSLICTEKKENKNKRNVQSRKQFVEMDNLDIIFHI